MALIPQTWQGSDESLRSYLLARTEEERKHSEEERTKQEAYRYETRKVELDLLKEALRGGVHPSLVPVLFAGGSGGAIGSTAEWAREYLQTQQAQAAQAQVQNQSQSQAQATREPAYSYASLPQLPQPQQQSHAQPPTQAAQPLQQPATATTPHAPPPIQTQPQVGMPAARPPFTPSRAPPRLQGFDTHIGNLTGSPPPSQSLFFHHYVPQQRQPQSGPVSSPTDTTQSPRKRKPSSSSTQGWKEASPGPSQPSPQPSAQPADPPQPAQPIAQPPQPPPRRRHARHRSEASGLTNFYEPYSTTRPTSRHRRGESGVDTLAAAASEHGRGGGQQIAEGTGRIDEKAEG